MEIVLYGDPVLRRKAKPIQKVTPSLRALAEQMLETMKAHDGIGLAAPQVGVSQRLVVVHVEEEDLVLMNPRIVARDGRATDTEGCLSFPGLQGKVTRPARITVQALNRLGREIKLEAEGLLARVIQHEMDHLDGVVFIDKVKEKTLHWLVPVEPGEGTEGPPAVREVPTTLAEVEEYFQKRWAERLAAQEKGKGEAA